MNHRLSIGSVAGGAASNVLQSNGISDTQAGIAGAGGFVGGGSAALIYR